MFTQRDQPLVDFIRGRLGCRCPDEALRSISIEAQGGTDGAPLYTRVAVSDRLLIYVMRPRPGKEWPTLVPALARAGRSERDRKGFNRFRLVIPAQEPDPIEVAATASFAAAVGADDRAHVHVVLECDVPEFASADCN